MPYRKVPFASGEIYHVFNRSIARQPIFLNQKDYQRGINVLQFYQYSNIPLRFSYYNRLPIDQKNDFFLKLKNGKKQVQILAYCFMPNHFHFLLKQLENNGIASFTSNIQNSYAKYFNIKHDRTGSLFQSMFKAIHIETDEQLLHVMRYIHLNPLTSFVVKDISALKQYPWSSLPEYLESKPIITESSFINKFFNTVDDFEKFIVDQANYQRQLHEIKHLLLE